MNILLHRRRRSNTINIKGVSVLIRNGKILELKKGKILDDGTLVVDNSKVWKLPKTDPYILKKRFNAEQLYIVDANTQAVYEFQDPSIETTGKLNPVILNPNTLYYYIASRSIQKLLGRITVSKGEAILYMFTGMVIIILLIFFILPILGHEIIIR